MRSGLHRLLLVLWLFLPGHSHAILYAQTNNNKIALIIGNSDYTNLPRLRNASRDALSVARALSDKGFTVFFAEDVDAIKLKEVVTFVSTQALNADQIIIYYAGHSEIKNGTSYLMPVNSNSGSKPADNQALSIVDLLNSFDIPFAQKAFILDICLLGPPDTYNTGTQSLSLPKALGLETLLIFATSFGQPAYDGAYDHSVFTGALLDYMAKDNLDLQSAAQSVRRDVIQASRANQIPVSVSTLTRPYVLNANVAYAQSFKPQNDLVQSYSSSGYADKPLLDIISLGINPTGF
jgi:uncharacterized caspase-like protein